MKRFLHLAAADASSAVLVAVAVAHGSLVDAGLAEIRAAKVNLNPNPLFKKVEA